MARTTHSYSSSLAETAHKLGASHEVGSWAKDADMMAVQQIGATLHETIRAQLHLPAIAVHHHGGTVTLTPAQGRAVLAGGELVVELGKAVVR